MSDSYLLVLTTSPDKQTAEQLAELLVNQSLAACVNILPLMQSIYRWKGEKQSSEEHQILIKTRCDKYNKLETCIRDNHPYELPEIIAIPIEQGYPQYLQWIDECCEENE